MKTRLVKLTAYPLCLTFLVSLLFGASGFVVCIGENGHIQFETFCHPSTCAVPDPVEVNDSDGIHADHGDCSGCSDIELDGTVWSRRMQEVQPDFQLTVNVSIILEFSEDCQSSEDRDASPESSELPFGLMPASSPIASTVLIC